MACRSGQVWKTIVAGLLALAVSGCGAAYFSPSVRAGSDGTIDVRVHPMTPANARIANQVPYQPKALPPAFSQDAGMGDGRMRGAGAIPPAPTTRETPPAAIERRLPPPVPQAPYDIGVGDVLLLATPQAGSTVAELSGLLAAQNRRQGYTVQDDGAIAIPDVGRIQLAGLTLQEAEAELFQALVAAQIDPAFSLEVAEFRSKRVSVGGAVRQPGVAPITLTPLTLEEAIASAGGLATEDLDFAVVRLYRDGTLYQVPVRDIFSGDAPGIALLDGDSVFVDTEYELAQAQAYFAEQIKLAEFQQQSRVLALNELQAEVSLRRAALAEQRTNFEAQIALDAVARDHVYLVGEVARAGRVALPFGQKAMLADVLFGEGAFDNARGNPSQIYVLRAAPDGPEELSIVDAWQLDARNAAHLLVATRFEMRPGDIIFIAEQPVTRWGRVVSQITPQLITTGVGAVSN